MSRLFTTQSENSAQIKHEIEKWAVTSDILCNKQ